MMLDHTRLDGDRKIELIDRVLRTIGDTQLLNGQQGTPTIYDFTGISLLIGALAQHQTLGLYHFHIVYDVVNLTGVSAAAAVTTTFKRPDGFFFSAVLLIVYTCLYLAFTILFGLKLQSWDDGSSGRCYNASRTSDPTAAHPLVDHIYLGITAFYLFGSLAMCRSVAPDTFRDAIKGLGQSFAAMVERLDQIDRPGPRFMADFSKLMIESWKTLERLISKYRVLQVVFATFLPRQIKMKPPFSDSSNNTSRLDDILEFYQANSNASPYKARVTILTLALAQYPVHGYMVYALRASNEKFLSGSSENEWGFGQIVAMTLVGSTLFECFKAWAVYGVERIGWSICQYRGKSRVHLLPPDTAFGSDEALNPVLPSNRQRG
ncbi:uncharacterized protein PG998_000020 [Apiospora kogelbergensis]|uniref:uncharacterized protein n=1 Tax=Apiospora kogelbergensis TaxID=1337665 RepID=UPI00312EC784